MQRRAELRSCFAGRDDQMKLRSILLLVISAPLVLSAVTQAQEEKRLTSAEIEGLPATEAGTGTSGVSGIQTRVLKGDPTKPGLYTIQLRVPANTTIQAHVHPDDRIATVISGTWYIGFGSQFDETKLKALTAGSFYTEPPVMHFARSGNHPAVVQITGYGPTGTKYFDTVAITNESKKNYQSQTANVNGVQIHYLKSGSGKKALVLIHGFGDTSHMWVPLFDEFSNDYTIIAPDMRGLGDSSKPAAGYDKKTIAKDIHELVRSLGYQQVTVVGHDIGLMVAYAYAAQYPNEVEKLALLDAPIPGIGDIWEKVYTTPALWHFHYVNSPIALDLVKGRERIFLEHFWQTLSPHPEKFSEADRQFYAQSYAQEGAMRAAFEMFKLFNTQDAEDNRKFAINKLAMPVLTIEGDKAMGGALAIQAKLVADNVRSIMLTDTGHWLMEQRPTEVRAELKKFFGN